MKYTIEVAFNNELSLTRSNYTIIVEATTSQEAVDKVRTRLFDYEYVRSVVSIMEDWK